MSCEISTKVLTSTVNLRSLEFLVEEAFTGIRRNGLMAFASISTTALALGILGAFVLLALGANNFASAQVSRFQIAVFVNGDDRESIQPIVERIRKLEGVAGLTIRDRDKEWAELKHQRPDIESAGLPLNVLPFALDVRVSDPNRLPVIAQKIRLMEGIDKVTEGREVLGRVMVVARLVKLMSIIGVGVLLATSTFIISNAIKLTLYARRREIRIMQLVGATNQFIRLPLVIEGVVFGTGGAIVAWALLAAGTSYLSHTVRKITFLGQFSSGLGPSDLALCLVVLGSVIGAAGSFVSIRRFLHD